MSLPKTALVAAAVGLVAVVVAVAVVLVAVTSLDDRPEWAQSPGWMYRNDELMSCRHRCHLLWPFELAVDDGNSFQSCCDCCCC